MNVCCDLASNENFIAQAFVLFLSAVNVFASCSKMFVLFLNKNVKKKKKKVNK